MGSIILDQYDIISKTGRPKNCPKIMDDMEDDARYPPKGHHYSRSRKLPLYPDTLPPHYNRDFLDDGLDYQNEIIDEEEEEEEDEEEDDDNYNPRSYLNFERYPKRQKLKNSVSNYEFAPRTAARLSHEDWNENDKFVLLEVWGERFLQLGRNSLRSEDWVEVAEKVSESSKTERTEAQCRQMMDALKRKYKKEMAKGASISKWAYFKKMDMLMKHEFGGVGGGGGGFRLACGVDSGEFVFMDTRVYLERANGNDEMRDSPCDSEEEEDDDDEEGGGGGRSATNEGLKGLRVLADSVRKFGEIYEKIESSKKDQMMELERMRVDFQRELELQKKQILEQAQAKIAKIREGDDEDEAEGDDDTDDEDGSGENVSE